MHNNVFDVTSPGYLVNGGNGIAIPALPLPNLLALVNNNLFGCSAGILGIEAVVYHSADLATLNGESYAANNLAFELRDGSNAYFVQESSDYRLKAGGAGDFLSVKTGAASSFSSLFTADGVAGDSRVNGTTCPCTRASKPRVGITGPATPRRGCCMRSLRTDTCTRPRT